MRAASNPVSRRVNTVMGGFMPLRRRSVQDPSSVWAPIRAETDERSAGRGAAGAQGWEARGGGSGSDGAVVADGHAGAVAFGAGAAEFDEAGDAVAVPVVGGEQFEHARVVCLAAGQRPAHRVRQVVVADGDGVRV